MKSVARMNRRNEEKTNLDLDARREASAMVDDDDELSL